MPNRRSASPTDQQPGSSNTADQSNLALHLRRIAEALDRLAPAAMSTPDFAQTEGFLWHSTPDYFQPVERINRVPLELLKGLERPSAQLLANTRRFAQGLPANNALLWGARGMGKSSLVKAVHATVCADTASSVKDARNAGSAGSARNAGSASKRTTGLKLIEIHREDIDSLPRCLGPMSASPHRFIVFCDDLSFDHDDTSYKSLKAVLEGGIEGRPDNVIFYATSNRRHMMPRDMIDNERSTAINPSEAVEEKVSLSDRFGLWLGFYKGSQDQYLEMVGSYADYFGLNYDREELRADALEWAATRGARSGRVAYQFIQDLAGRLGQPLKLD